MDSVTTLPVKRKAIAAVKTPFPDALMPFLADKVSTLATGNLSWLIESLYQDLKAHKVKKVSIDAKVREVVEKCPSKKIWVVKGDILVRSSLQYMTFDKELANVGIDLSDFNRTANCVHCERWLSFRLLRTWPGLSTVAYAKPHCVSYLLSYYLHFLPVYSLPSIICHWNKYKNWYNRYNIWACT